MEKVTNGEFRRIHLNVCALNPGVLYLRRIHFIFKKYYKLVQKLITFVIHKFVKVEKDDV